MHPEKRSDHKMQYYNGRISFTWKVNSACIFLATYIFITQSVGGYIVVMFLLFFNINWLYKTIHKLLGAAEEDAEIDMGEIELDDTNMHQLSHRELFLSRQYETINASQIRLVKVCQLPNLNMLINELSKAWSPETYVVMALFYCVLF